MEKEKCKICGGTAGQLSPNGAHHLCEERRKRGVATPSLGDVCPTCNGKTFISKSNSTPFLMFDLGPAAIRRAIDAVFKTCPMCKGRGKINIEFPGDYGDNGVYWDPDWKGEGE